MLNITVAHPSLGRGSPETTTDTVTENDAGVLNDETAGEHTHDYLTPGIFGKEIPSFPIVFYYVPCVVYAGTD